MSKKIYVAKLKLRYGDAALTEISVERETEKSYFVGSMRKLIGWQYLPTRITKSQYNCFDSLDEALQWLKQRAERYAESCHSRLGDAIQQRNSIEDMISGLE